MYNLSINLLYTADLISVKFGSDGRIKKHIHLLHHLTNLFKISFKLHYTCMCIGCPLCRFRVKIEPIKQEKFDTGIQMKNMDYIDVPASSKKDYKLSFYAYRESVNSMKVSTDLQLQGDKNNNISYPGKDLPLKEMEHMTNCSY